MRDLIATRLVAPRERVSPEMPKCGGGDPGSVKASLAKRLSGSRLFGRGAQAGGGGGSAKAGSVTLYVPASQRAMVKVFIGRHSGPRGVANPGKALAQHVSYLAREGAGQDGLDAGFYDLDGSRNAEEVGAQCAGWEQDRHHFRLIISAEHGDKIEDMDAYVKGVMEKVSLDLKEPNLEWVAVNHYDTDQPHSHVMMRGKRANGRDLVIPRSYVSHGLRERAQEQAQAILGDSSRSDAERGLFTRSTANRWTDIDIRLSALARSHDGLLPKSELSRRDTVGALVRARVGHLEGLGLATKSRHGVAFASDLKARLDALQKSQDIMRSHWEAKCSSGPPAKSRPLEVLIGGQRGRSDAKRDDMAAHRLLPQDVELARLGQSGRGRQGDGGQRDPNLEARAEFLVSKGYGVRQSEGIGFKPEAWAKLRDADAAHALEKELGISGRVFSHGLSEGVVIGSVTTSLGKQTVIDRGVGIAIAPVSGGQELAIGHVIGAGLER
ncbi:MAG: type VI secretion protein [Aquidulcibacter sp.]|nr:type VI secretion protein [Aquidulcibacter sp.]